MKKQTSNIDDKIEELRNTYYQNNSKNVIFKKKQKNDCANIISQNINLQELLHHTFIVNENIIIFRYTIFKTFASNENQKYILQYFSNILIHLINTYSSFIMHIDMNTYTISAHERYKDWYSKFFQICCDKDIQFSNHLQYLHCYNTPTLINNLQSFFNSFIDKNAQSKITLFNKEESIGKIENILKNNNINN